LRSIVTRDGAEARPPKVLQQRIGARNALRLYKPLKLFVFKDFGGGY
jgi:hypothetical protein